jgi:hypothetical protein
MNNFLLINENINPNTLEGWENLVFNVTRTLTPYVPFCIYFCYSLPEKTQLVWK